MATEKPTFGFNKAMPSASPAPAAPVATAPAAAQPVDQVADLAATQATSKPARRSRKAKTSVEAGDVFKTVVIKLSHDEYMLARKLQLSMEATGGAATSLAAIAKNEFLRLAQRKAGE